MDVPGFDSPHPEHMEQTCAAVLAADAFLCLSSAQRPSFTGPAIAVLEKIRESHYDALGARAFGIITQLDTIDSRQFVCSFLLVFNPC